MAEVERGRTGISLKTLSAICSLLVLSADYLIFEAEQDTDSLLLEKIHWLDEKYFPLADDLLTTLLALK